jgi:hypothetical protein
MDNERKLRGLVEAFDACDSRYKRQEMEEAAALQTGITPYLIQILEDLATDPEAYSLDGNYANVYAVALLAHFQEPAAHQPIIKAFLIDKKNLDELWGDMVTETLPALLFQTCNGSLDEIKRLILNKDAHEYVRGAAVGALTYAVARGVAERQETVDFLAALFTGSEAEEDSYFWSNIAASIADLHPEGAMDNVRDAFARGLIHPDYVGLGEIEADCKKPKETLLEELRRKADYGIPRDIHGYLSWFSCFHDERDFRPVEPFNNTKVQKKKKTVSRVKRKMAKQSRKKNRKK